MISFLIYLFLSSIWELEIFKILCEIKPDFLYDFIDSFIYPIIGLLDFVWHYAIICETDNGHPLGSSELKEPSHIISQERGPRIDPSRTPQVAPWPWSIKGILHFESNPFQCRHLLIALTVDIAFGNPRCLPGRLPFLWSVQGY